MTDPARAAPCSTRLALTMPESMARCHGGGQSLEAAIAVKMPATTAHVTSTE
jgi:hypothetical protein